MLNFSGCPFHLVVLYINFLTRGDIVYSISIYRKPSLSEEQSMVIVTQLEARYSKTAFVRIYVNCKQLILFKQAL